MSDRFFDQHQRETVGAALARMSPSNGTPSTDTRLVVDLLDRYLAGRAEGYPGPDEQTHVLSRGLGLVRQKYVDGIIELDRRSRSTFGTHFTGLTRDKQDRVLTDMEDAEDGPEPADVAVAAGVVPDDDAPSPACGLADMGFLPLLAIHARPGFLARAAHRPAAI